MKVKLPTSVVVPLRVPSVASVMPVGSVPAVTVQLYGARPPVGARVVVYAEPEVAPGMFCVATLSVVALMVSEKPWLTFCADASVTFTVKFDVPTAVGVPLSTPAVESEIPVGSVPLETVKLNGASPPDVLMVAL